MAGPSIKFKKLLFTYEQRDRDQILFKLSNWLMTQHSEDPQAAALSSTMQMLCNSNGYKPKSDFMNDSEWLMMRSYDTCVSLEAIVKAKLAIPDKEKKPKPKEPEEKEEKSKEPKEPKEPRKAIPKKIRGEAWRIAFGDSMKGQCYCCKKELDAFDTWHAGHIIASCNGGKDIATNLRPTCGSCNLSMGTENMDDFKARCYPA
jgi:hypothetical protein